MAKFELVSPSLGWSMRGGTPLPGLVDQPGPGADAVIFIPMRLYLCWVPGSVSPQPHLGRESALSER